MCLELYTFELLQPTNLLAHVARERESNGKVFQGCCRQYVPIIFRFPTLLSILGFLYYIYVHIYIIMTVCATPLSPCRQSQRWIKIPSELLRSVQVLRFGSAVCFSRCADDGHDVFT